ncbi:MBOAT family O-acyltransferase [Muribaculum intestinale]|jgi:alginate O-acetyltransferase complex protein AlgI|uniref:MBOAT family O-acyltransferase n=1 Tax=Muribaculum intestinale TaxID=1796646 RepID=UPI003514E7B1
MMIWVILLLGIITYYTIGRRYQSTLLVAMSLYVYWIVARWNIIPITALSLVITLFGKLLENRHSKSFVITPIILIILCFILLRYSNVGIVLPIGMSVLSFTGISYLVDQYRNPKHYKSIEVICYLLFFPKIFAGPIERANNFINSEIRSFQIANIYKGIKYLIFAAFCKFIIGDIASSTNFEVLGLGLLFQMLTFGISFFFDFWAYTLMAIGVGELFGYTLSVSFDKPYYAGSFREFWHRWNITLGAWLRDYIYIPCGGNRLSLPRWSLTVLLVFMVSGLWHGATLPFIIWGVFHACLVCFEKMVVRPQNLPACLRYLYGAIVVLITALLWQLFIVDSMEDILLRFGNMLIAAPLEVKPLVQLAVSVVAMVVLTSDRVFNLVRFESTRKRGIITEVTMLSLMLTTLFILNCPISFNFFYFRF